jgi:hypothetical protein
MNEVMTLAEIEAAFPSEWVLIDQPQTDRYQQILSGRVVCHSKDRDEVYHRALTLPIPRNIAFHYTGPVPEPGTAIIL